MSEQPRVLRLDEILTPEMCEDVESLVGQIRTGKVKLDSLRFYLQAQSEHLAAHEVDASYLFYSLGYSLNLF